MNDLVFLVGFAVGVSIGTVALTAFWRLDTGFDTKRPAYSPADLDREFES